MFEVRRNFGRQDSGRFSFFLNLYRKVFSFRFFEDRSLIFSSVSGSKSVLFKKEYQFILTFLFVIIISIFSVRIYFYSKSTESIKYLQKENKELKEINNDLLKKLEKASLDFEKFSSYFDELKKVGISSLSSVDYQMYNKYLLSYKNYLDTGNRGFSGLKIKKPSYSDVKKVKTNVEYVNAKLDNLISECFNKINLRLSALIKKVSSIGLLSGDKVSINAIKSKRFNIKALDNLNDYYYDKNNQLNQGGPLDFYNEYKVHFPLNSLSLDENIDSDKNEDSLDISSDFMKNIILLEDIVLSLPKKYPMKNFAITSTFGSRIDPFTRSIAHHGGVDFFSKKNSQILSVSDGIVIRSDLSSSYGNVVEVKHGSHIITRYAHMSSRIVKVGDIVKTGDVLGKQGDTGRAHGDHLHFEILFDNERLDPLKFLKLI